ncbi:MAG: autotransporter-associated beta strand repeat-containing protein [Pirellulales bacterium]|nr:autotransporter-associated beta strand repeat-containing protein [Pirellulales bacterium]
MKGRFVSWSSIFRAFAVVVAGALLPMCTLSAEEFDWRNVEGHNWLTPVKSQFGGTCWAFGSMGTVETHYKLTRNDFSFNPDISEQQVVWETNPDMGSTGGGYEMDALHYATTHGIVSEAECPYQPSSPDVGIPPYWPLASGWESRVWKNAGDGAITSTTTNIKSKLKTNGPLLTAIASWNDLYGSVAELKANYRSPIYDIDHAVVIVGYYDDAEVPSGGYWVIKNSWSEGWGEAGYGFVPYGSIESHYRTEAVNGPTYYTGAMASAAWSGGAGTWAAGDGAKWGGYAWENLETNATFNGTGGAVAISGTAIAHGMTVSATGYTFTGGNLTVTAGGITANQSTTINSPVTVGAPQTWNVASGKTLTVNGAVHTVISNLTITGSGHTTLGGPIDGGGVINTYGGAAPGNIYKTGTGTLKFSGAANYSGNINATGGTLNFAPPSGVTAAFSGVISGSRPVTKTDAGTTIFSGANTYSGTTTISAGALQADNGVGLPSSRFLSLAGGVLQSNGTVTFTRSLGTSGNRFQWTTSGGGFAAGAGPMTVRVNNGTGTLSWGTSGNVIKGTLKFGSQSAANLVDFQNGINLGSSTRTIQVDDNPATGADYAKISGVISGTGGLTKTGAGLLALTAGNSYSGTTTISAGALQADNGAGLPSSRFLSLAGGVLQNNTASSFTRSLGTSGGTFQFTSSGGGFAAGTTALNVRINNDAGSVISWGTSGNVIKGTLKFGSPTAANTVTLENVLDLNGAERTFYVEDNPGTSSDLAVISGVITDVQAFSSGNWTGAIRKTGTGTLVLTARNENGQGDGSAGNTTVADGALQADRDLGLSGWAGLILEGGVLQSNSAITYAEPLWAYGSDARRVKWLSGGFSAGGGKMTVNIGGAAATVNFGDADGTQGIAGILKLSSKTARYETELLNGLNLNNGSRTIHVDDNSFDSGDLATLSGVISGSGSLTKTGLGTLRLCGSSGNTYSGTTTVTDGTLILAKTSGYAVPGNLTISAATDRTFVVLNGSNQINPSAMVTFAGGYWPYLSLHGNNQTLAGISDSTGLGVIQNTFDETDVTQTSTLTVNNAADCSFNGYLRNTRYGTGLLALAKSGAGTLTLSGGNIVYTGGTTINGGKLVLQNVTDPGFLASAVTNNGTLELSNPGDITWNAPVSGSGAISKPGTNTLTLGANVACSGGLNIGGGRVVLTDNTSALLGGPIIDGGTLEVNANATNMTISGAISNGAAVGELVKNGPGTLTLTGANTYGDGVGWIGFTTVNGGILQADRGVGLPTGSCLVLNGGSVFQSNSAATFDTGFWYDWGFLVWNNGGFSAGGGKMTVNLYGDGRTLTWGDNGYVNLAGTMFLNSPSAQYETEIRNGINLNGADRTIQVNDNPYSSGDYASLTGAITGTGGIVKTGPGVLYLRGPSGNTFSGNTTVTGGALVLAKTSGYAVPGNLVMSAPSGSPFVYVQGANQIAPSSVLTFAGGYWPHFLLYGNNVTVAGISDPYGTGVIENTQDETGVGNATLTVNNSANYGFSGYLRDHWAGSGLLAIVKGGDGTLALSGPNSGGYTGGLTVNAGVLDYSAGVLPSCTITINGGTLIPPGGGGMAAAAGGEEASGGESGGPSRPSIVNNAEFVIPEGSAPLVLDTLTGPGTTHLEGDAQLIASSIAQSELIIGGDSGRESVPLTLGLSTEPEIASLGNDAQNSASDIVPDMPIPGGKNPDSIPLTLGVANQGVPMALSGTRSMTPVPEPGTLILLLALGVLFGGKTLAKRIQG